MSVDSIEMVESENGRSASDRGPYKSRDLFGIQLEVTSLLLDAELMKLSTLQSELISQSQYPEHEEQQVELIFAISRIQAQVEQLEREYKTHALGALKNAPLRGKSNRSQPAIGLKYLPKLRPSIFGTVATSPSPDPSNPLNHQRKTFPQTQIIGNGSIPKSESQSQSQHSHHHHHHHRNGSSSISSTCSSTSSTSSTASTEDVNLQSSSSLNGTYGPSTNLSTNQRNDWDNALVYQDTNLVAGTLDALIQHLVPSQTYYPNRAYIFAFLLSSRLYIRPHELLGRVFRLAVATSQHSTKFHTARETKIISHVVQLLGEWAELFPYDFRDERMMAHVRTITQKCVSVDPLIRKDVSQLLTTLLARLTALERYEDFLHRINTEAALAEPLTAPSILTICPNPTMLAQQLTHIELERLSHIGPEEFVQAFAKDNAQVETKYKDMKKTRNLESYVQWFNRLSYYVATEICKMPKKKSRIRVIEYWIEAARECFNIGNFNSLMAIIAGLNMSPVARLKKTWAKVSSAQLSILEHQMDPSSNFTSYRSTLKAAVWRSAGATDERQRIVIPFFSLLVKDLYFLNEGCASKLPNGHINFDKFWQLAKQVTEVMAWQQITCPFPKVQAVLNSLQTVPIFSENTLCLSSYECEAADNAQEKERLKYLRQDGNGSGGTNNKSKVSQINSAIGPTSENGKDKKIEDLKNHSPASTGGPTTISPLTLLVNHPPQQPFVQRSIPPQKLFVHDPPSTFTTKILRTPFTGAGGTGFCLATDSSTYIYNNSRKLLHGSGSRTTHKFTSPGPTSAPVPSTVRTTTNGFLPNYQNPKSSKGLTTATTTALLNSESISHNDECPVVHGISSPSTSSSSNPEPSSSRAHLPSSLGLIFEESRLVGGSLEGLLAHLVPTDTYYPDRAYAFSFLLGSRLWIQPHEVLGSLFSSALSLRDLTQYGSIRELNILSNIIKLLKLWTELFPYDFRDEKMMAHVRAITEKCVALESECAKEEVSQLLRTLLGRLTALERHEMFIHRLISNSAQDEPSGLTSPYSTPSILTLCPSPMVLAQQLAHIEMEFLSFIGPQELLHDFLKESSLMSSSVGSCSGGTGSCTSSSSSTGNHHPPPTRTTLGTIHSLFLDTANLKLSTGRDVKKTKNLEAYLFWNSKLATFVGTEVCKIRRKKGRADVIEHWILTGKECFNIGNFNSLMAILYGLQLPPVQRLKKTWSRVDSAGLKWLKEQMSPGNYKCTLEAVGSTRFPGASTSTTDERQRTLIPFIRILLQDLCSLSKECVAKLPNGYINYESFWLLAKQVTEFMTWQKAPCPFPKVQSLITQLQFPSTFPEAGLWIASYESEPPNNSTEKEHSKALRQQQEQNESLPSILNTLSLNLPSTPAAPHGTLGKPQSHSGSRTGLHNTQEF